MELPEEKTTRTSAEGNRGLADEEDSNIRRILKRQKVR
jgi:hypothetical protein